MARSFTLTVQSPATVEQVLAAFGDPQYWQARLAALSGGTGVLDELRVDGDGTVTVATTSSLLRDRLPKIITQVHRGDVHLVRRERWRWVEDGRVHGEITASVPGAPLSVAGEALLAPAPTGSRGDYTTIVSVSLPLVAASIENYIGGQATEQITALQRFTTEWIAAQG